MSRTPIFLQARTYPDGDLVSFNPERVSLFHESRGKSGKRWTTVSIDGEMIFIDSTMEDLAMVLSAFSYCLPVGAFREEVLERNKDSLPSGGATVTTTVGEA